MKREFTINQKTINEENPCYVIAEIGHNHQGKIEIARELFLMAKMCGASAVKLQKRNNRTLFTKKLFESPYESENSFGSTYGEHRETLELKVHEYLDLRTFARELNLDFLATAFDFESADFLRTLDIDGFKIASGDIKNIPLIRHVASFDKPLILSTGGAELEDVVKAHESAVALNSNICLLQCTASYPVEPKEMNLRVIETYRQRFATTVIGLSDHQSGIAMAPVAYLLGARVIEKHFTLNRAMKGTDHAFSLEPVGFRKLVRDLARVQMALGDGVKRVYESERKPLFKMAKKMVASKDLSQGHILTSSDIAIRSPNDGLSPDHFDFVIGRRLTCSLKEDDNITYSVLTEE